MDPATIVGLLIAFGSLYAMATLEGVHLDSLLLPAPMILVFGGTIAVGLAGGTFKDFIRGFAALPAAFKGKTPNMHAVIDQIVAIAEIARRDGLLKLEEEGAKTKDPFLKNALQNVADGTNQEDLANILEEEIHAKHKLASMNAKFFKALGGYAPTVGIIGTVVSLTHVLENLSAPDKLGPMIAAAFVATLWGLLSANFIWLPIGDRMHRLAEMEQDRMTLIMEGMIAVQVGNQPRVIRERLEVMVPAAGKKGAKKAPKEAAAS